MTGTRVLIIDDEKENVRYLSTILEENGFKDIHGAFDGEEGLTKVKALNPGLILLDLRMPKKNGIFVFNDLKKSPDYRDIPVIILTGEGGFLKNLAELRQFHENGAGLGDTPTEEVLNLFIDVRPNAFLEKPIEPEALMAAVQRVLITMGEIKEKRLREINALRERKLEGEVVFKGATFQCNARSRNNLTATAVMLANGGSLPENFAWRSSDNQNIPMTREDLFAFHAAVTAWVYNHYKVSWEHKAAIDSLTTVEDVRNYDTYSGWPDNSL